MGLLYFAIKDSEAEYNISSESFQNRAVLRGDIQHLSIIFIAAIYRVRLKPGVLPMFSYVIIPAPQWGGFYCFHTHLTDAQSEVHSGREAIPRSQGMHAGVGIRFQLFLIPSLSCGSAFLDVWIFLGSRERQEWDGGGLECPRRGLSGFLQAMESSGPQAGEVV